MWLHFVTHRSAWLSTWPMWNPKHWSSSMRRHQEPRGSGGRGRTSPEDVVKRLDRQGVVYGSDLEGRWRWRANMDLRSHGTGWTLAVGAVCSCTSMHHHACGHRGIPSRQ
jgi:hypothetical protein